MQPGAAIQQTQNLFVLVSVQYRSEHYFNDPPPPSDPSATPPDPAVRGRDGWDVRVGFDQFWLFNNKRSCARWAITMTQRSEGSDWDYNGHEVSLAGQTPLGAGITLDVQGAYYRFNYQSVNSFSCCTDARGIRIPDLNPASQLGYAGADRQPLYRWPRPVTRGRAYFTLSAGYVHQESVEHRLL